MTERKFTDLELERSLAGDLSPARASVLETQATDADRARLAELAAEHAAFLSTVDVDAEVRRIEQRVERAKPARPWWHWFASAGVLAAAAVAVLVLVSRKPHEKPVDDDLQTKGDGISLVLHTPTGSLATGDSVAPGTRLRFEANGTRSGFVAIVGIDGAGTASVYYPFGGTAPAPIDLERMLPGAIQLDATPGDERFFALFSAHSFTIQTALAALQHGAPLPDGISASEVVLHKH